MMQSIMLGLGLSLAAGPAVLPSSAPGWRLTMKLEVEKTTDDAESTGVFGGNTEDEIYYVLAGVAHRSGKDVSMGGTFRRNGNPDVWEMGAASARSLERNLLEVDLKRGDWVALNVTIAEQDNAQLTALTALTSALAGDLQGLAGTAFGWSAGRMAAGAAAGLFGSVLAKEIEEIGDSGDQIVGSFNVGVEPGKLTLSGLGTAGAKAGFSVLPTTKHVVLSQHGARYRVQLRLTPRSEPAPKGRTYLSTELDMCSEVALTVPSTEGDVVIKKGQTRDVRIPDRRFEWYCGTTQEWATAPPNTNLVEAYRASTGRRIKWRCFEEHTLSPDLRP